MSGILTQEMLNISGDVFIVRGEMTLAGATVTIPKGKTLVFSGGSLDDGEIVGTGTSVRMMQTRPAFGLNLVISGLWNVPEVHDGWFSFDDSKEFISNRIINNILAFSNDETPCHIFFEEDRTYFFELPYKGREDIGNTVGYRTTAKGNQKRDYSEIFNEKYKDLRIFIIPSNTHLTVKNTLKMLPTSVGAYFVFWEYGKENVTVDGTGVIAGDNDWHRYDHPFMGKSYYGEYGHVFKCFRCSNFTFKDITVSDSFGDCIMYSGSFFDDEKENRWASNLTMDNVKILRARRNGVAVGARNVVIRNCHFEGCGTKAVRGTAPRSAIDFEPDRVLEHPEIGNENVLMENCTFADNYFDVASYMNNVRTYGSLATTIRNCTFHSPLKITSTYWMRFENCYIPFVNNPEDSRSVMLYSRNMEFVNCEFGEYDTSVLAKAKAVNNKYINCKFNTAKKNQ